jgi:hypothetical protein
MEAAKSGCGDAKHRVENSEPVASSGVPINFGLTFRLMNSGQSRPEFNARFDFSTSRVDTACQFIASFDLPDHKRPLQHYLL